MQEPLKIIFAGTPSIAKVVLEKLVNKKFKVDLVLTQPDRPSGRGNKVNQSPVKEFAIANNIEVFQPTSFKADPSAILKIRNLNPDIIIVVAYGLILPEDLLNIPRLGCVNMHVSLLPKHRGAAPIQRAILAGDNKTGVTIMQMDIGLDTGDILLQEEMDISDNDTSGTIHDHMANVGSELLIQYLENYSEIIPKKQSNIEVSYAHKIDKSEAKIDWRNTALEINRKVRAFNPVPGSFSVLGGTLVKIWQTAVTNLLSNEVAGTIFKASEDEIFVSCGDGSVIAIQQLQEAGKTKQSAKQYLLGHQNLVGNIFQS